MFGIGAVIAVMVEVEKRKALEAHWANLPKEEADQARAEYRQKLRDDIAHYRALEIARESRPKNWLQTLLGQ